MVMKPQKPYLVVHCNNCHWEGLFYQKSDVLIYPHKCPKCESDDTTLSFMSFFGFLLHRIKKNK